MTNKEVLSLLSSVLNNIDGKVEQIKTDNSIYKKGTYKISKEFKNASDYEIESWANNILKSLNNYNDINKNCDYDFRIYNGGNEKWNKGLLFIWIK